MWAGLCNRETKQEHLEACTQVQASVRHATCESSAGQLQSRSHWECVQEHGRFPTGTVT
jgi:hypothetical protein